MLWFRSITFNLCWILTDAWPAVSYSSLVSYLFCSHYLWPLLPQLKLFYTLQRKRKKTIRLKFLQILSFTSNIIRPLVIFFPLISEKDMFFFSMLILLFSLFHLLLLFHILLIHSSKAVLSLYLSIDWNIPCMLCQWTKSQKNLKPLIFHSSSIRRW